MRAEEWICHRSNVPHMSTLQFHIVAENQPVIYESFVWQTPQRLSPCLAGTVSHISEAAEWENNALY